MTSPTFPDFNKYPNSLKVEEVGRFAQRLIVRSHSPTQELERMLSHCPNLQDFAIWLQPIKFLLPTLKKLSLIRLSADFSDLVHDDYLSSAFSNITHLDVIRFHGRTWKEWEVLSKLPHLSHLIVGFPVDHDVFPNLLRYASQLRILIFMPEQYHMTAWLRNHDKNQHNLLENDDRFVLLNCPAFPGLAEDWVKGGESGLDNWTFCELILIARRRKFNPITLIQSLICQYFFILVGNFFLDDSRQLLQRVFDWDKNLTDEGKKWYSELNWQDPWSKLVLSHERKVEHER